MVALKVPVPVVETGAAASLNPLRDSRNFPLPSSENANPLAVTARTIPPTMMSLFIPASDRLSEIQPDPSDPRRAASGMTNRDLWRQTFCETEVRLQRTFQAAPAQKRREETNAPATDLPGAKAVTGGVTRRGSVTARGGVWG